MESRLWTLNDILLESKYIFGEYGAQNIDESFTNLKVSIMSYGFEVFDLEVAISDYPKPPKIKYSEKLQNLVKNSPIFGFYEELEEKESVRVDVIREIAWLSGKRVPESISS